MIELEKKIEAVGKFLNQRSEELQKANETFRKAESAYKEASEARYEMLQTILKEKGLAVCADSHYTAIAETYRPIKDPTAEDLGIFPRDKMRLRFAAGSAFHHDREAGSSDYRFLEVKLLCPDHFAAESGLYTSKSWPDWPLTETEAVQENGRIILKLSGNDVTEFVAWARKYIRPEIDLEGNLYPDVLVYRHFGIPDLPEQPRW
ncbi:MAG TPA: hypothetical protein VJ227_02730 [Patescibacteria group bacterium]|nr:hypothetical protein [Patescibacteria group bacterium]